MEKKILELEKKIDHIIEIQKQILEKLTYTSIEKPKPAFKKLTKKQVKQELENEFRLCILNGNDIKQKFNLAITPQKNRILKYLRTNDPSIFDGLKRKN
ncbi:hypothetical protein [Winogradskyella sp. PC D3.3]